MHSINIVCDYLSANALGFMGSEWVKTRHLDQFAHQSLVFDHCFSVLDLESKDSQSASVCPSLASKRISDRDRAHSSSHALGEVFEEAASWMESVRRERFVLWIELNLFQSCWQPSEDWIETYLESSPVDLTGSRVGMLDEVVTEDELDAYRDTYAARVSELDAGIGTFFESLKKLDLYDTGLVAFTARQGWPLGEHETIGPARPWAHEERDHVPLVVRWPGGRQASRSPSLACTHDLVPTIDEFLQVQSEEVGEGISLGSILTGRPFAPREMIFAGLADEEYAIRTQLWKLILPVAPTEDRPRQLYAKPEDRWEMNNLAEQHPDIADHLELQLRRYLDARQRGTLANLPPLRKDLLHGNR